MLKARNWTPEKRLLKKLSIQRQKRCYSQPQLPVRLTSSISKSIGLQKKRRRTLERLNPLILSLLIYLVGNSSNRARLAKKTRTTNKFLGAAKKKDRVPAMTLLLWVSISFLRKKRRTLPKSSAIFAIGKSINPINIFKI